MRGPGARAESAKIESGPPRASLRARLDGAVLFTWLYNGAGGSVLMVAIWHALFDLLSASAAGRDFIPIGTSAGVIIWALIVANVEKPWGFRFQPRQTLLGASRQ